MVINDHLNLAIEEKTRLMFSVVVSQLLSFYFHYIPTLQSRYLQIQMSLPQVFPSHSGLTL